MTAPAVPFPAHAARQLTQRARDLLVELAIVVATEGPALQLSTAWLRRRGIHGTPSALASCVRQLRRAGLVVRVTTFTRGRAHRWRATWAPPASAGRGRGPCHVDSVPRGGTRADFDRFSAPKVTAAVQSDSTFGAAESAPGEVSEVRS